MTPNIGDSIFEIYSIGNKLHIIKLPILSISKKGLFGCGFNRYNGFKPSSLNQFNLYRIYHFYHCYSLLNELEQNVILFRKRFKKVTGENCSKIITSSSKIKRHPNYFKKYSITHKEYIDLLKLN